MSKTILYTEEDTRNFYNFKLNISNNIQLTVVFLIHIRLFAKFAIPIIIIIYYLYDCVSQQF